MTSALQRAGGAIKKLTNTKKSLLHSDSNPRPTKAHVPEGRYQTPPGIQVRVFRSAEARVQASLGFLGVMTGI